jgi:diguanylate cyclase (GGDEF)-like protein/PAS domain S-box-containing protein
MKPSVMFLRILVIIATVEALVMIVFWLFDIHGLWPIMIDTGLLVALSTPFLHLWVVEPVRRKDRRTFMTVIDAAADMIVITDRNGLIEYVNPSFTSITGYAPDEVIGRKTSVVKSGAHNQTFYRSIWQTILEGKVWFGEIVNRRKDGTLYPEEQSITPIRGADGQIERFVAIKRDITDRKHAEELVQQITFYDTLTNLPNRNNLYKHLLNAIGTASGTGTPIALLLIDLNQFREINDTLGHDKGDQVLQQVGRKLREVMFEHDIVARHGGDEFAVLLLNMAKAKDVDVEVQKILKALDTPFLIEGLPIMIEASIGASIYPDHGKEAETLFNRADIALHVSKNSGIPYTVYHPAKDKHSPQRLAMMGELHHAIEHGDLLLFYQPAISLKTRRIIGVEALIRWKHPTRGIIPPDQFILSAEKTGLIHPLTRWVMAAAMRQCKAWHDAGMKLAISVNLSARNLVDPKLPDQVAEQFRAAQVAPEWMTFEITESVIMANPAQALEVLTRLHEMGARLSIDDFGTGYSSLSYLKRLPVETIKIDKSFVINMTKNQSDALIVRSTIDLAHNMNLKVVAEGVEDKDIWDRLHALGCDTAQGYYMGRPMPADELSRWLHESSWGLKKNSTYAQTGKR